MPSYVVGARTIQKAAELLRSDFANGRITVGTHHFSSRAGARSFALWLRNTKQGTPETLRRVGGVGEYAYMWPVFVVYREPVDTMRVITEWMSLHPEP